MNKRQRKKYNESHAVLSIIVKSTKPSDEVLDILLENAEACGLLVYGTLRQGRDKTAQGKTVYQFDAVMYHETEKFNIRTSMKEWEIKIDHAKLSSMGSFVIVKVNPKNYKYIQLSRKAEQRKKRLIANWENAGGIKC